MLWLKDIAVLAALALFGGSILGLAFAADPLGKVITDLVASWL